MSLRPVLPFLLLVSLACSEGESTVRAEARDVWTDLKAYTAEESAAFAEKAREQLHHLTVAGDMFENSLEGAVDAGSDELKEAQAGMERRVDELRAALDDLGDEARDDWESARDEVVDKLQELESFLERQTQDS